MDERTSPLLLSTFGLHRFFFNRQVLIGVDILESADLPTGPPDLHLIYQRCTTQSKEQARVGCRAIARAAQTLLSSPPSTSRDRNFHTDAIAIAGCSCQCNAQPVVPVAPVVSQQRGWFSYVY